MRKFFASILLCLGALFSFAQPQSASLVIQADQHEMFWIFVNNVLQNNDPSEAVFVNNLTTGVYSISVTMNNPSQTSMTTQIQTHEGKNYYSVSFDPYYNRITLRCVDQDVQMANSMVGSFMQMTVQMNAMYEADVNRPVGQPDPHHPQGAPVPAPAPGMAPPPPVPAGPMPCNDRDFHEIKMLVANETFEDKKLTIAKQATQAEWLTVDQLAEIAMLFDFENTKLEYLKFAYDYCFDPNKYYKLNKVFEFSYSIEELNDYIQSRRR
ncbi:MAG: DUF4476 domain-containing protein [Bacteroidales bacterium]|nr:DUF4476 domain-containing protein [Bacteroidales bacterium]